MKLQSYGIYLCMFTKCHCACWLCSPQISTYKRILKMKDAQHFVSLQDTNTFVMLCPPRRRSRHLLKHNVISSEFPKNGVCCIVYQKADFKRHPNAASKNSNQAQQYDVFISFYFDWLCWAINVCSRDPAIHFRDRLAEKHPNYRLGAIFKRPASSTQNHIWR